MLSFVLTLYLKKKTNKRSVQERRKKQSVPRNHLRESALKKQYTLNR